MSKKKNGVLEAIDKLVCLLVAFPPLYMLYRFVRWYLRSESRIEGEEDAHGEPIS